MGSGLALDRGNLNIGLTIVETDSNSLERDTNSVRLGDSVAGADISVKSYVSAGADISAEADDSVEADGDNSVADADDPAADGDNSPKTDDSAKKVDCEIR